MLYRNYHTHTTYCDGKDRIEDFVKQAEILNFKQLCFSAHAPIYRDNNFAINPQDIESYVDEINYLQKQGSSVKLLKSLECDYIPNQTKNFEWFKKNYGLDYIIGGVHLVKSRSDEALWFIDGSKQEIYDEGLKNIFHQDIKMAVKTYFEQLFEMIETQQFDILAHFDKIKMHNQNRYFSEDEKWYQDYIYQTIELVKSKSLIVEVNTRGLYKKRYADFYPGVKWLKNLTQNKIKMVVSTDAHLKTEVALYYKEALEALLASGCQTLVEFHQGQWV